MNNHYLQFVREQLIIATADLSGATKGQLEAWQENAMAYGEGLPLPDSYDAP
ncbi:bacteriophage antitermination protein Q, partial [Escherichia coli]|uniref:bacteriophage antitermination protein Q n=1 Tax=Escherichia coli TaxID=562 RepID=UPI002078BCC8